MLRGQCEIGDAHQCVWSSGIDIKAMVFSDCLGELKGHINPATLANPIALHGFNLLGPLV